MRLLSFLIILIPETCEFLFFYRNLLTISSITGMIIAIDTSTPGRQQQSQGQPRTMTSNQPWMKFQQSREIIAMGVMTAKGREGLGGHTGFLKLVTFNFSHQPNLAF